MNKLKVERDNLVKEVASETELRKQIKAAVLQQEHEKAKASGFRFDALNATEEVQFVLRKIDDIRLHMLPFGNRLAEASFEGKVKKLIENYRFALRRKLSLNTSVTT